MGKSLVDALATPDSSKQTTACKFTHIRAQLSEEEQQALDTAIIGIRNDAGLGKTKRYSTSWLTKVLKSFGYTISMSTIQRHVNKECSCERIGE